MPAIVTDVGTSEVVMFAWMNQEALDETLSSGFAHYWSRTRKKLWQKGETSGNKQAVKEIRIDCDQDVLWLAVETAGDGLNCHTGAKTCFYRRVTGSPNSPTLVFDDAG